MTVYEDGQVSLFAQDSWSGKTCLEHSLPTEEKISGRSSRKRSGSSSRKPPLFLCLRQDGPQADASWVTDGALLGVYSMHSFGECPRDGVESRLSQILEAEPHWKYYLSAKACQGILNRAARRGKDLPEALKASLLMQSESGGGCDGGGKGALVQKELSGTLGCNNDQTIFCLNDQGGSVMGISQDISGTLRAQEHGHQPIVLENRPADSRIKISKDGVLQTLSSRMGTGGGNTPYIMQGFGDYRAGDVSSSCKQRDSKGGTDLVCAVDCRNGMENADVNGTLQAKSSGGTSYNLQNVVRENMLVRRLTPLECERLQGFPDGWTDIGPWTDSKGKLHKESSDSCRYKALGNSIALPPWKWVLKRLCAQYERGATMASLFDGIGGFPLIWEQLNGKGSCLWASEIEEFPMAVTRKRFG